MFLFRLRNEKATKHLWKCAIEHHTFFRLRAPSKGPSARQNFFRMGSRFRYSGRTEFQNTVTSRGQSRSRRTVQFERRPSQRYARRQSHVLREKDRDRKKKETEAKLSTQPQTTTLASQWQTRSWMTKRSSPRPRRSRMQPRMSPPAAVPTGALAF